MKFDVVRPLEHKSEFWVYIVGAISFLILYVSVDMEHLLELWFGEENTLIFYFTFLLLWVISLIIKVSGIYPSSDKIGILEISKLGFSIDSEVIEFNKFKDSLRFEISDYKGGGHNGRDDGIRNLIKFNISGECLEYQVLLKGPSHFEELKKTIEGLYDTDFNVVEYRYSEKSYLLNNNLSYEEIQVLKKRFGVKVWL